MAVFRSFAWLHVFSEKAGGGLTFASLLAYLFLLVINQSKKVIVFKFRHDPCLAIKNKSKGFFPIFEFRIFFNF